METTKPQKRNNRKSKTPKNTQSNDNSNRKRTNETSLANSTKKKQYQKKTNNDQSFLTEYEAEVEANKLLASFQSTECHSTPNQSLINN